MPNANTSPIAENSTPIDQAKIVDFNKKKNFWRGTLIMMILVWLLAFNFTLYLFEGQWSIAVTAVLAALPVVLLPISLQLRKLNRELKAFATVA
jgi:hypothetical protein